MHHHLLRKVISLPGLLATRVSNSFVMSDDVFGMMII